MRTAADADGRLLAREAIVDFDTGAYADNGPRVVATGGDAAPGPYRWSAVRVRAACVHTNTAPSGSYRAFGASHVQWVGELQVDEVARRAGLDPLEMRRRNLLRRGEVVRPRRQGTRRGPRGRRREGRGGARLGRAARRGPRARPLGRAARGRRAPGVSSAIVRLESDGEAVVLVGSTELGQGQRTAFAQIAARGAGAARRAGALPRHGHAVHALRPLDRREPLDDAGRARRPAGGSRRSARTCSTSRARSGRTPRTRPSSSGTASPAWGEDSRTYAQLIARRFGLSGGQLIGEGGVHPTGTGSYAEGPVFWEVCIAAAEVSVDRGTGRRHGRTDRDGRRRGQGHQPAARGAAGRGRHDAGHRQRAVRGAPIRRGSAAQRRPARVPGAFDRGPARDAPAVSSSRTRTGRGPSGPRAAARAPSRASSARSRPRLRTRASR